MNDRAPKIGELWEFISPEGKVINRWRITGKKNNEYLGENVLKENVFVPGAPNNPLGSSPPGEQTLSWPNTQFGEWKHVAYLCANCDQWVSSDDCNYLCEDCRAT